MIKVNKTHEFSDRFAQMRASGDYFVTVIEDLRNNKIIGSATLVLEHKFIHDCSVVCKFHLTFRNYVIIL